MRALLLPLLLLTACATSRPAFDAEQEAAAIRQVLDQQVAAWNAGEVRAFMEGYARTDSLRFASGSTVRYGWQETLDGYLRGYPDRAAMGTLRFVLRDLNVISPAWAVVFGEWHLERANDAPHGLFTLLLEKRPEGWRIVADHTSS